MKTIITIWTILIGSIGFSQTDLIKEKLSYHSFSVTPIEIFLSSYADGIAISADLSFAVFKNIFSLSGIIGEEQVLFGKVDRFKELNMLYGMDFELIDFLFLQTHAGIGLVFFNDPTDVKDTKTGFPLVAKLRFKAGERFSMGLKLQANINSIENMFSAGILLQWNFI